MKVPCKNIPTYNANTGEWSTTSFENQIEFGKYLLKTCFKEPGQYNFRGIKDGISQVGKYWEQHKIYTDLPVNSKDWEEWWETEELKSRLGVLWHQDDDIWYVTRDYYFFLNFCPIINKEKHQEETMVTFRDVQYHMMLYEKIAEALHLHSAILKRRQMAYSFSHVAKSLNFYIFENKKTIKWFAFDDAFIDAENGSWKILNAYKNHLQTYTAWNKVSTPNEYPSIQQKEKIKVGNQWITEGNDSTIVAKTLKKDPKNGVGGPAFWVWYEEGGIAPTADATKTFMDPAMESGMEKVGSFCIGGSVGDLKQCKPLEKFIKNPSKYQFLGVPTKWYDKTEKEQICGLFIPAQYGMPEATDEEGNSLVELALELLHKAEFIGYEEGEYGRIQAEEPWINLPEEQYIIKKSQNPKNIEEAFAYREVLFFPTRLIEKRQKELNIIQEKVKPKMGLLEERDGKIEFVPLSKMSNPPTPMTFPVDPKQKDKRGVVTIYKDPPKNPEYLQFFGGIDTIESTGKTTTSNSLFSIYIVERLTEITSFKDGVKNIEYGGGSIVASYVGRFDDIEDTHEQAELLIRLYNAFTACERNKPSFINHMRRRGFATKHMMKRREFQLFKDVDQTGLSNDDFGVYMAADGRAELILNDNIKEHLQQIQDVIRKKDKDGDEKDGDVVKTYRGVDFIEDYWLLEELKQWYPDLNTDRRVAYGLAHMAAKQYTLTYGTKKIHVKSTEKKVPQAPRQRSLLPGHRQQNKPRQINKSLLPNSKR